MIGKKQLLWLIGLTLVSFLLAACAVPQPTPTQTPVPTEQVAEWDLVFISDSSGRGVGERYAAYIESDLDVTVALHDLAIDSLSARSVLNALRDPEGNAYNLRLKQLGVTDLISEAEVVVFYANPVASTSETHPGDWDCVSFNPYVVDCSPETFDVYRADLDASYEEIFTLRGNSPTIVRAFDAYNPLYSVWSEHGVYGECMRCWENYNETIHQAAAAHSVPVARLWDTFNGPNHMRTQETKATLDPMGYTPSQPGGMSSLISCGSWVTNTLSPSSQGGSSLTQMPDDIAEPWWLYGQG